MLLELFFFFVTNKNLQIAIKSFFVFDTLKEFINRGYKFYNFSLEEKIDFCNYFLKIIEHLLFNCKLKRLKLSLKKEVAFAEDIDYEDEDSNDGESLKNYRREAEYVYYHIFHIIHNNFGNNGEDYIFKFINNILDNVLNGINNTNNTTSFNGTNEIEFILILESLLHFFKSFSDAYEDNAVNKSNIIEFISKIINSKILENLNFLLIFLTFLDKAHFLISKDSNLFNIISILLLNIIKNYGSSNIELFCSKILESISDSNENLNYALFDITYKEYIQLYESISLLSLSKIASFLCNLIVIVDKEDKQIVKYNKEEVVKYLELLMEPSKLRIEKAYEMLENNFSSNTELNLEQKIKYELNKNFVLCHNILKTGYLINVQILNSLFTTYMNKFYVISEKVLKLFAKDTNFVKEILNVYPKILFYLQFNANIYFEALNKLILDLFNLNNDNFHLISILSILYSQVASSAENKNYILENFLLISDFIITNISNMKKNQLDALIKFADFFYLTVSSFYFENVLIVKEQKSFLIIDNIVNILSFNLQNICEQDLNKIIIKIFGFILKSSSIFSNEFVSNKYQIIVYSVLQACNYIDSHNINDVKLK